jgi:nucleoid-associated protein YgaU
MSVMSAAEARQVAGAGPDVPPPRLQIARSASRPEDADAGLAAAAEAPPGAGSRRHAGDKVTPAQAALRVRHVKVVRQVSIRSRRASVVGPARPAGTGRSEHAGEPARVAGQARAWTIAQPPATDRRTPMHQLQAAAHTGAATRALVTRRTLVTRQTVAGARAQRRPGSVRLTRRGRLVIAGLAILVIASVVTVLVIAAAVSVQASSHATAPGSVYRGMTQVVVQPGQTLWSIAAAADPSGNAWAVVQQIINANALPSVTVQAGQLLWVPRA